MNGLRNPNDKISSPSIPGEVTSMSFNVPLASALTAGTVPSQGTVPFVKGTALRRGKSAGNEVDSESMDISACSTNASGAHTSVSLDPRAVRDVPSKISPAFTPRVWLYAVGSFLTCGYGTLLALDASYTHAKSIPEDEVYNHRPHWFFVIFGSVASDRGDPQLRQFLKQLPLIAFAFTAVVAIARYIRINNSVKDLQLFYVAAGTILLMILYGIDVLVCYMFYFLNYALIVRNHRRMPYWAYLALTWTFHVGILVMSDSFRGFGWQSWRSFEELVLDYTGWKEMMRWNVLYKLSVLRMIAYDNDVREAAFYGAERREKAILKHDQTCVECAQLREANGGKINAHPTDNNNNNNTATRCYKFRTEASRPLEDYNFRSYLAYLLYPPLFLAGPIMSFNSFSSYCTAASLSMSTQKLFMYAFRIFIIFVLIQVIIHFVHTNLFRKEPESFAALTAGTQATFMFYMLAFLWLKFNLIWKTFRLFALIDGVEPPENMNRCFANTLTVQDFWRDWHSSFNQWVVRYMYIPMGGNKTRFLNIFPIFIFIGLWHDLTLNMVHWAGCIIAFFIVELSARKFFGMRMFAPIRASKYYHYLLGVGGALSIGGLIVANLVGFATVATAEVEESDKTSATGSLITDGIKKAGTSFYFMVFAAFYCTAHVARAERAMRENRQKRLQEQYGLLSRVEAPINNNCPDRSPLGVALFNGGNGSPSRARLEDGGNGYGDAEEGRAKRVE